MCFIALNNLFPYFHGWIQSVIGSWKTIAILLPRIFRILLLSISNKFCPSNSIFPETKKVFISNNFNMLIDIRLFPLPDSPIIPKISFSNSLNETLSTIFSVGFFLRQILSFFISNIGLLAFKN